MWRKPKNLISEIGATALLTVTVVLRLIIRTDFNPGIWYWLIANLATIALIFRTHSAQFCLHVELLELDSEEVTDTLIKVNPNQVCPGVYSCQFLCQLLISEEQKVRSI